MEDVQQQGFITVKVLSNIIAAGWTITTLHRTAPIVVKFSPGPAATTAILKIFATKSDNELMRMYDRAVTIDISGRKQGADTL